MPDIRLVEQIVTNIFPRSSRPSIEHVEEGVSTFVYRIYRAGEIFYLRVLPEVDDSFAPEVYVHQLLRDRRVKVPEVIYFEHLNEILQRSIMVTTEIKGTHLGHWPALQDLQSILLEAGKDLAIINSIPVRHFGWIRRDSSVVTQLQAEIPSYRAFIYEHLESDLGILEEQLLKRGEIAVLRLILDRFDGWLDDKEAWLVHGDFDVTHIYQNQGRYTGIIDFGEIRGANSMYDLGYFMMHDGETLPSLVFPHLIAGYQQVATLPPNYEQKVRLSSLLIAIRTLARTAQKHPEKIHNHQCLKSVQREIASNLLWL